MKASLAVLLLLCAGCAQTLYWAKPGTTLQDFHQDNYTCQREANLAAGAPSYLYVPGQIPLLLPVDQRQQMHQLCMQSRGWSLRPGP